MGKPVLIKTLGDHGLALTAGAAGSLGTDTNPAPAFTGLNSNDVIIHAYIADTTLQLYDSTTNKKLIDIAVASNTNANFGLKTLGELAKAATGYDPTHVMDLRYSAGATIASDTTIFGSIVFSPAGGC